MRKFLVIAVLAGLAVLFVAQKRDEPQKTAPEKKLAQTATTSPRPVSEHNWMKRSLERTN
jgi:hypothetical protein